MDQEKLTKLVKKYPQVWDRNHPQFREKTVKDHFWEEIAKLMESPASQCKEVFKALREKYLREREKSRSLNYIPWSLLEELSFLEPHIMQRKQTNSSEDLVKAEEYSHMIGEDENSQYMDNINEFDVNLVALVKKATPIWDRNCKTFTSKTLKFELWKNISVKLNRDLNECMLRWKALREKYIRQKTKYQEGDAKWALLDEMSFLDSVIQYRRKGSDRDNSTNYINYNTLDMSMSSHSNLDVSASKSFTTDSYCYSNIRIRDNYSNGSSNQYVDSENSVSDSTNEYILAIKQEPEMPDSSIDLSRNRNRKRSCSSNSDLENTKRDKVSNESQVNQSLKSIGTRQKTAEQLFGDFVASMLAKKNNSEKNSAMVEIMKILTK